MSQSINISFIVPIYNVESFLAQCLNSLLEQPVTKEIILIDDGSTDNSLSIALNYAKQYPNILILHTSNQGAAAARNKGLKLAQGEYISFIDSDDYLSGNIAPLIEQAKQHNADLIRFRPIFSIDDKLMDIYHNPVPFLEKTQLITGYHFLEQMYKENCWVPGVCWTIIKKSYLDAHQLTFEEGVIAEDQLFYVQLLTASENCLLLNQPSLYYIYRQNNNISVSKHRNENYVLDHLAIISYIWNYLLKQPESIQLPILYVTHRIIYSIINVVEEWTLEQRQQFPYFHREDWQQVLIKYYPIQWKRIQQLYELNKE